MPDIADIAGTKMLIFLHIILTMAVFVIGLFGGYCLGRFGFRRPKLS